ncbi:MAG: hypothetical protein ACR2NP_21360 [Pirellulaceae bacterium]
MKYFRIALFPCLALALLAKGCDSSSSAKNDKDSNRQETQPGTPINPELLKQFPGLPTPMRPAEPVQLGYRLEPGQKWRIVFDQKLYMDSMGMKVDESAEAEMSFECLSADDDGFEVTSRISKLVSGIDTPGGSYRIDTVDPSKTEAAAIFQPMIDIWTDVLNAEATFRVTTAGTLPDVQVPQTILDAFEDHQEAAERFAVTPESLFVNFVVGFFEVPATPLEVGDKWQPEVPIPPQGAGSVDATATFLGVAEFEGRRVAVIELVSSFGKPESNEMFTKFEMRGDAIALFDIDGGYLWKEYISRSGDFELEINESSMEQSLTGEVLISRVEE